MAISINRRRAGGAAAHRATRSNMKYTLSDRAYCKLILHALKHPLRSVCGALIGRCDGDVVQVIDAIPYLHTTVATAPNAEIALEQSCAYAGSGGNALVGYYHANERMDDDRMSKHAAKIADCVERNGGAPGGSACALLVDASALAEATERGTGRAAVRLLVKKGAGWERASDQGDLRVGGGANAKLAALARDGRAKAVFDFDDHLDDITADWRNLALNEELD